MTATDVPAKDAAAPPADRRVGLWRPTLSLWRREMVRFVRQRNRVISSVLTPLVFWLVLGAGMSRAFVAPEFVDAEITYFAYFYPGAVLLMLLNTAVFSTISVIEDRREGFLQSVLVSPAPRLAIALGKVFGGATIATLQGLIFLALWPLIGGWPGIPAMISAALLMFAIAVGLTALGLCLAWPMNSTQGFHAIMLLLLLPMWFMSGSAFPFASAPLWQKAIMLINPLTYGHAAFTAAMTGRGHAPGAPLPATWASMLTFGGAAAMCLLAAAIVARRRKDGRT